MKNHKAQMQDDADRLARAFPFLKESQRVLLQDHIDIQPLEKGESLFGAGDCAENLYLLLEGRLAVKKRTGFGRSSQVIALLSPFSPVGEGVFGYSGERRASVVAIEDSLLYRLGKPAFSTLQREQPEISIAILTHLLAIANLRLEKCSERLAHIL